MSNRDLRKLRKTELLQIIYEQEKNIKSLEKEISCLNEKINDRTIELEEAGSIAEASLKINKIFEDAQKAADEYLNSVKKLSQSKKNNDSITNDNKVESTKEERKDSHDSKNICVKKGYELVLVNHNLAVIKKSLIKKIKDLWYRFVKKIYNLKLKIKKNRLKRLEKKKENELKKKNDINSKKTINLKDYDLSIENIENELKSRKNKESKLKFVKSLTYCGIVIVAFSIIIATRVFNVLKVSGNSMEPSLSQGELLISSKIFGYEKGDIIAFYYNDSVLIKRVIATEGDIVYIDDEGNVYVNSQKLEENYVEELALGNNNITYPYRVMNKEIFVLGDNRKTSIDSRSNEIGAISEDKVLGKILINLNRLSFY